MFCRNPLGSLGLFVAGATHLRAWSCSKASSALNPDISACLASLCVGHMNLQYQNYLFNVKLCYQVAPQAVLPGAGKCWRGSGLAEDSDAPAPSGAAGGVPAPGSGAGVRVRQVQGRGPGSEPRLRAPACLSSGARRWRCSPAA